METKRCFIAIDLNVEVRRRLDWVMQCFKAYDLPSVRWVSSQNMHLTIKFLGEVLEEKIPALQNVLERICIYTPPFYMISTGLGVFPGIQSPRVIWAGINAPDVILTLQRTIEQETRRLGFPVESRPYNPHLTLGRVGDSITQQEAGRVVRAIREIDANNMGTVLADSIHLFHSDLRPSGPVYTSLRTFPLKGIASNP